MLTTLRKRCFDTKRIGVDESGKGDYFGYLVVAAVYVADEEPLRRMGVKDSKMLSDLMVSELAKKIKKLCEYDIVKVSPEKYNSLYPKFSSLNKLLAWGHAQAIENLLEKTGAKTAITDKFGDEALVENELKRREIKIELIQKVNGERDIAVAAASIIARDEFLRTLRALGREIGAVLPKGATHVEEAAKALVKKYGKEILDSVAKKHFKTTKRVLKDI